MSMPTPLKSFILVCAVSVATASPSLAQLTNAPADTNAIATNSAPAGQAPDDVVQKLSGLIHAGKYAEAQQLTSGLLLAYPDDQRLIKAKTLLDKLLTSATPSDNSTNVAHPINNAAPSRPENTSDEFVGVGMQVAFYQTSDNFKIVDVLPNSSAAQAGLSSGLILDMVDGVPTRAKSLQEVINLIRGAIGTKVRLELINPETKESTDVELTRQKIQLAQDTNPAQLTGMDKVEYNSLIELGHEAQQTTDLDQQKASLNQFMRESGVFLGRHPHEMLLWQLRAASAISLNYPLAGYEAGQKLLASGNADNDRVMQRLLSQLNIKGWLDKQRIEAEVIQENNLKKFGWLLGKWDVAWKWTDRGGSIILHHLIGNRGGEEFIFTNSTIQGFEIAPSGNRSEIPDLRGTILDNGSIKWECYLPPSDPHGLCMFRASYVTGTFQTDMSPDYWETIKRKEYFPSGWQPVISYDRLMSSVRPIGMLATIGFLASPVFAPSKPSGNNSHNGQMTIVIPSQSADPKSDSPLKRPVTLVFTKAGGEESQQVPAQHSQPQGGFFNSIQGGK